MQHLTEAVRRAVTEQNWYAALALALTLPDICGRAETPEVGSKTRYVQWCTTYLTPRYTARIGPDRSKHVFLHGEDAYALRCAVLHEGADDILDQRARKALDSFEFVTPGPVLVHCNQHNQRLQLQVDVFCQDICDGVDTWAAKVAARRSEVQARVRDLMVIAPLTADRFWYSGDTDTPTV